MILKTNTFGEAGQNPPLVIVHGLFGSARNWGVIAKRLSDERQVITVDMRNHANSGWADTHSYADLADDLKDTLGQMGSTFDLLGHSMGGKAAMVLALRNPALVNRLIVADIAPVAYAHTQQGPIDAMLGVDIASVEKRQDAADQMQGIADDLKPFLLQSLDLKEKRWRLNLDVLAAEMDKIIGFPEIDGQFSAPCLFLSGAASDYVMAEHRDKIRRLFPTARFAKLPGAGHWLHAEKPREFEAAVRVFLNT